MLHLFQLRPVVKLEITQEIYLLTKLTHTLQVRGQEINHHLADAGISN